MKKDVYQQPTIKISNLRGTIILSNSMTTETYRRSEKSYNDDDLE